jgi:hypothetical protein
VRQEKVLSEQMEDVLQRATIQTTVARNVSIFRLRSQRRAIFDPVREARLTVSD